MTFVRPDRQPDWADTIGGPLIDPGMTAKEAFLHALGAWPAWLRAALVVRNMVVAPFGLKTELEGDGHLLTRMPVVTEKPEHYETGIADRHLSFTIAVHVQNASVYMTTAIWYNNWLGRVYLRVVMPGHILAVRHAAGRVAHPISRRSGEFNESVIL
ncbi:MAG: DUF2867 domain-containing protein [Pseudomonadota bacterium]